ncbi:CAP domain-containing protein [Duganella sp. PWIR1]
MRKLPCVNHSVLTKTDSRNPILSSSRALILRTLPVTIAVLLAACGGGGSGTPSAGVTTPTTPTGPTMPVVTPGDTQTTVPALTYAATSEEYAFVTALNDFRSKVGLGLLAQNTKLDTASANHLSYIITNDVNNGGSVNFNTYDSTTGRSMLHIENGALAKFTGIQEAERAKFAQYDGSYVGEEVTFGGKQGGAVAFATLAQTVYHRAGLMMQNVREIGVAVGTDKSQTVVMEMGLKTNQSVASDYVGVYPSNGQTGVALHAYVEAPNPFPDLSTANSDFPTKTSYPISVSVVTGNTIAVTTFTVTEAGQTAPMDARLMTRSNDPNSYLSSNVAFLIAKAPFKAGTTYNVKFAGTNNGAAFTKDWSFATK